MKLICKYRWVVGLLTASVLSTALGAAAPDELAPDDDSTYGFAVPSVEASPAAVVDALEQALLQTLRRSAGTGFDERRQRLAPVVRRVFNHDRMSALVLGAAWREIDAGARRRFAALFEALSVATYARRFVNDSGQRFERVEAPQPEAAQAMVRTRMIRPDKEPVAFSYHLMHGDAGWQVVGIQANGVSELAIRRSQYARLYAEGGIDAVTADLRAEIAHLEQS